jgi:acetyl esterase/lipase
VATPEYRRVGTGGSGGWPRTGEDVRRAASRLPELLAAIGGEVGTLRVTGHSAGGHLALWLATTGVAIDRVVALAPVCDLREAIRRGLGSDATRAFLGEADPDEADPMVLLDDRPAADLRVVHGVDDDVVPVDLSRGLVRRHPWIRLTEVPGGHFEVIEPGSVAWPTVLAELG